jgi:tetratricopeptide (TPR) repeat protein
MRIYLLATFIFITAVSSGQINKKYWHIDSLINTNKMFDASAAIRELKQTHQKDTTDSQYWVRYSKASYIYYRYDDAKSGIDKAIKLSPNNSEYYYEKGVLLNKLDELDGALSAMDNAVRISPIGEYFWQRGMINQQLKKNENAQSDYQKAIDNKFKNPMLYGNFAGLLIETERYDKALEMVNKALVLDNKFPQGYSMRARINFLLLNVSASCIDSKTALEMGYRETFSIPDSVCNSSQAKKMQYAAEMLAGSKFYKQGALAFTKVIESKLLKSDLFLNRGYCYFHLKEFEKSEKDYLRALTLPNPELDLLYDNLSLLYFTQENFQKAIEYATKRIELNPKNPVPYIDRGLCYRKLKQYQAAEDEFNKSLEIKPDFFRAFGYRSFLYLELGQYSKSLEDASKSVKINPKYGYGYLVLGQAKEQLGITDFCSDFYNAKKYGEPDADLAIKTHCK